MRKNRRLAVAIRVMDVTAISCRNEEVVRELGGRKEDHTDGKSICL